jgi:hypothetical protein
MFIYIDILLINHSNNDDNNNKRQIWWRAVEGCYQISLSEMVNMLIYARKLNKVVYLNYGMI